MAAVKRPDARVRSTVMEALWWDFDIGGPRVSGLSAGLGDTIAVAGGGVGIDEERDQFHFTFQRLTGDGDVQARLVSLEQVHPNATAGVMVRRSMDPDAEHVSLLATHKGGVRFQRRLVPGGHTWSTVAAATLQGHWLRLERRGPVVKALVSSDGATWTLSGSIELELEDDVYVGLAVSSHKANELATAMFESPLVMPLEPRIPPSEPSAPDAPPEPEIPAPSPEPSPQPRVPDPAAPEPPLTEPLPPPPPPVGEPAPEESSPPSSSVASPSFLVFEPSADHATVHSYVVEIVSGGASSLPIATYNLGKPPVVSGECRVEVTPLLALLPSGSYVAALRAVSATGTSAPAFSSLFQR